MLKIKRTDYILPNGKRSVNYRMIAPGDSRIPSIKITYEGIEMGYGSGLTTDQVVLKGIDDINDFVQLVEMCRRHVQSLIHFNKPIKAEEEPHFVVVVAVKRFVNGTFEEEVICNALKDN